MVAKKRSNKTLKKRPLSDWNKFVMNVKKQNPDKMFKDVLKLAGELKKKGVNYAEYAKNKTEKASSKVKKFVSKKVKSVKKLVNKKKRTMKNKRNGKKKN